MTNCVTSDSIAFQWELEGRKKKPFYLHYRWRICSLNILFIGCKPIKVSQLMSNACRLTQCKSKFGKQLADEGFTPDDHLFLHEGQVWELSHSSQTCCQSKDQKWNYCRNSQSCEKVITTSAMQARVTNALRLMSSNKICTQTVWRWKINENACILCPLHLYISIGKGMIRLSKTVN